MVLHGYFESCRMEGGEVTFPSRRITAGMSERRWQLPFGRHGDQSTAGWNSGQPQRAALGTVLPNGRETLPRCTVAVDNSRQCGAPWSASKFGHQGVQLACCAVPTKKFISAGVLDLEQGKGHVRA